MKITFATCTCLSMWTWSHLLMYLPPFIYASRTQITVSVPCGHPVESQWPYQQNLPSGLKMSHVCLFLFPPADSRSIAAGCRLSDVSDIQSWWVNSLCCWLNRVTSLKGMSFTVCVHLLTPLWKHWLPQINTIKVALIYDVTRTIFCFFLIEVCFSESDI